MKNYDNFNNTHKKKSHMDIIISYDICDDEFRNALLEKLKNEYKGKEITKSTYFLENIDVKKLKGEIGDLIEQSSEISDVETGNKINIQKIYVDSGSLKYEAIIENKFCKK